MLKVVHLQNHLPTSGNAAFRLHKAMRDSDIDSYMLTLTSAQSASKTNVSLGTKAVLRSLINSKFHNYQTKNIEQKYGLFSSPKLGNNVASHEFVKQADIIYVHWAIGGFLTLKNIEQLAKTGVPVIIFMHDMWHITGGCHHSFDCNNYTSGCTTCQMFPADNSLPSKGYNKKEKFYNKYHNLYFVSPSSWLAELAKKSGLTKSKHIFHIPNVIDATLFKTFNKKTARNILKLSQTNTIISFGAISPTSPYKGWKYLKEALIILSKEVNVKNITIAIFGSDYNEEIDKLIPFETTFLGRFYDDYSTSLVYNASDVFMAPSIADNLPTTVLESLSCGTPVVGFNVGGIPDMIKHKKNGFLAKYKDANDLSEGIKFCLSEKLQVFIPAEFNKETIINSHKSLHTKVLTEFTL